MPALALSPDQNAAIVTEAQPDGTVSLVVRELGSGTQQTIFVTPPRRIPLRRSVSARRSGRPRRMSSSIGWTTRPARRRPRIAHCRASRASADGTGLKRLSDSGRFPAFGRGSSRLVYLDRYTFLPGRAVSSPLRAARRYVVSVGAATDPRSRRTVARSPGSAGPRRRRRPTSARCCVSLAPAAHSYSFACSSSAWTQPWRVGPLAWSSMNGRSPSSTRRSRGQSAEERALLRNADAAFGALPEYAGPLAAPLWSPDGRRVAVGATLQSGGQRSSLSTLAGKLLPKFCERHRGGIRAARLVARWSPPLLRRP